MMTVVKDKMQSLQHCGHLLWEYSFYFRLFPPKDGRSGVRGADCYGDEIWQVFENHHLRFKEVFERMQN
jgi:hypothetical protein